MIDIYRWATLERWDAFTIPRLHIAPHLPQVRIGDLLLPRSEIVDRKQWSFEALQPITIHFGGEISRRRMAEGVEYSMPLYWVRPGDVVLSKIDLKNGAVGVLPSDWDNVVVTSHFQVYKPDLTRLNPQYFRMLLRTNEFKEWLWASRSGADGRTEVKLDVFEDLLIPVPDIEVQEQLVRDYEAALAESSRIEALAENVLKGANEAFKAALGASAPLPLPEKPMFVARFSDVERWSHEGILRAVCKADQIDYNFPLKTLGELVDDLENGWSPSCIERPAAADKWGVLKVGAVSFGHFNESENKELPDSLEPIPRFEVQAGDVLISRANVTRYVGACAYVPETRPRLMLCDKLFRVKFKPNGELHGPFLAAVMKLPMVRDQIEGQLTGTSPTMKNISKPALLGLRFPAPDPSIQRKLSDELAAAGVAAAKRRTEAALVKVSAWRDFEAVLFGPESATANLIH